ncbi:MAG: hypothetical protein ACK5MR_09645 [Cumulibacter sp.]
MTERPALDPVAGLAKGVTLPPPPARPRSQRTPARAEPLEPSPATKGREVESTGRSVVRPSSKAQPKDSTKADAEGVMQAITLSLPAALVVALKARARADRTTQPETLMDALSATQERLADLVARMQATVISDGLFLRKQARTSSDPMATLSLRLLAGTVEAIDRLAALVDAPSRSALCAAALKEYLGVETT